MAQHRAKAQSRGPLVDRGTFGSQGNLSSDVIQPSGRDKVKIAQIAPLMESVPPRLYGGTERIVSYLTEELVGLGHEVTLFASGDSITAANLVPCVPKALRLDRQRPRPYSLLHVDARSRPPTGRRVRRPALPYRSIPFSAFSTDRIPHRYHASRPPGSARSDPALSGFRRHAAGFDLERPAPTDTERELRGNGLPRPPDAPAPRQRGDARQATSPFSAEFRPRNVPTAPSLLRGHWEFRSRSPPRSIALMRLISGRRSNHCSKGAVLNLSARSMTARKRNSSATHRRCCFQSTGRSRSGFR